MKSKAAADSESNDKTANPGTSSFRNGCLRNKYDPFLQDERIHNLGSEEKPFSTASFHLPSPSNKEYYTRDEAAQLVVTRTLKGTKARGLIIDAMLKSGHIPVKRTAFTRLLTDVENLVKIVGENWGNYKGSKVFRLYFEGPCKRVGCDWEGSILLKVAVVEQEHLRSFATSDETMSKMKQWLVSNAKEVDICDHIGKKYFRRQSYRHRSDWKTCRLYLDPEQFPLPPPSVKITTSTQLAAVKDYIRMMANKRGNPVVCNGGKNASKIFQCAVCYRRRGRSDRKLFTGKKSCDFNFTLKWDSVGFYIHLFDFGCKYVQEGVGCIFHTCDPLKNEFFRDSYGIHEVE